MAESVQFHLESMVPALRDLERKEIFTQNEIKLIVKKRTDFEYALQRRQTQLIDFLRYIEYEQNLELLRQKRKKRLNITGKQTLSDYAGIQHILHLFNRATRKFPGDLTLWREYVAFATKTKSLRVAGKVLAKSLQMHPRCVQLWIMAAGWEWKENSNVSAARVLMQRGLRLNSDSEDLWIEYFKLEWLFLIKILERQKILGVAPQNQQDAVSINEDSVDLSNLPDSDDQPKETENNQSASAFTDFLKGILPKLVFQQAIASLPQSFALRCKFLKECHDLAQVFDCVDDALKQVVEAIYDSVARDFQDCEALSFLAERSLDPVIGRKNQMEGFKETVLEYNKCLGAETKMFAKFALFLQKFADSDVEPMAKFSRLCLDRLMEEAIMKKHADETMFLIWSRYSDTKSSEEILQLAVKEIPQSSQCWSSLIQCKSGSVLDRCKEAVSSLNLIPLGIWRIYLQNLINAAGENEVLEVFSQAIRHLSDHHPESDTVEILKDYLSWMRTSISIPRARQIVKK